MHDSTEISRAVAREELVKFFAIADLATKAPEMFSAYIDAEWHQLIDNPSGYQDFCHAAVGHPVGHAPDKGEGTPSWLGKYHIRYGMLPSIWFADESGKIDHTLYDQYLAIYRTQPDGPPPHELVDGVSLVTAWDCTPTTGDPDYAAPVTRRPFVTAWDCTPTTGDPDFAKPEIITAAELVDA